MNEKKRDLLIFEPLPELKEAMEKEGERIDLKPSLHWQLAALTYLRSRNKLSDALAEKFKTLFKTLK